MNKRKSILLVDDDLDFLRAHRLIFEAAGFDVSVAATSTEAIEVANRVVPDAAVLDVVMEGPYAGFTLARRLREGEKTKHIRLVILSSVNQKNREKGMHFEFTDQDRDERWLPVDKILEKPVKPNELVSLVQQLTGAPV